MELAAPSAAAAVAAASSPPSSASVNGAAQQIILKGGPDFEEGPYSQIGEDEFYDAVDIALDKHEEDIRLRDMLRAMSVDRTRKGITYWSLAGGVFSRWAPFLSFPSSN